MAKTESLGSIKDKLLSFRNNRNKIKKIIVPKPITSTIYLGSKVIA